MKKTLALLLSLFLLFSVLSFSASAAAKGKLSLTGDAEDLSRGDTFEVTVELNRNPGVTSLRTTVGFDPKVLEVIKVDALGLLPGYNADQKEDEIVLRWKRESVGADLTAKGNLARITFRVLENAIYGDSSISIEVSQKLYDAQNSQGKSVPFDTVSLPFTLVCPHKNPEVSVVTEASFEAEGVAKNTCPDCGESWETPLLPTLSSEDGKTVATLAAGEYLNTDEKSLRTEYLYGGEDAEKAKSLFGDSLVRAFRVHLTRGSVSFSPQEECRIRLKTDFDLPEDVMLYVLPDGGAEAVEMKREGKELEFLWQDMIYVLVARAEDAAPEIPDATTSPEKAPTTTLSPQDQARRRDIFLIIGGATALVLCGAGAVFLAGKRKHF